MVDDIAAGVVDLNICNGVLHLESGLFWVFIPFKYIEGALKSDGPSAFVEKDRERPLRCILYREDAKSYYMFEGVQHDNMIEMRCWRYSLASRKLDCFENIVKDEFYVINDASVENICCAYNNQLRRFLMAFVEEYDDEGYHDWKLHEVQFKVEDEVTLVKSTIYESSAFAEGPLFASS